MTRLKSQNVKADHRRLILSTRLHKSIVGAIAKDTTTLGKIEATAVTGDSQKLSWEGIIQPACGWLWKPVILRLSDRILILWLWYSESAEEPRTARPTLPTQAPRIAAIDLKCRRGLEDKQPRYDCNSPGRTSATRTQFSRQVMLSQLHRSTRMSIRWHLIGWISRAMSRPKSRELRGRRRQPGHRG